MSTWVMTLQTKFSVMHIIHDIKWAFVHVNVMQKWHMRTHLWFVPVFTKGQKQKQQQQKTLVLDMHHIHSIENTNKESMTCFSF